MAARLVVVRLRRLDESTLTRLSARLRNLERELSGRSLHGAARISEEVRRFFRDVLEELPLGVCIAGSVGDVALWNRTMTRITGLPADAALHCELSHLPAPWAELLSGFAEGAATQIETTQRVGDEDRILTLRRSHTHWVDARPSVVIMIEDRTLEEAVRRRVEHQDKLASIGRLAAQVGHDVRNPLAAIGLELSAFSRADDERWRVRADRIAVLLDQIEAIVRDLIDFARGADRGEKMPVALNDVVAQAVRLMQLTLRGTQRMIRIESDVPGDLVVQGHRQRLQQAILNVLTNACQASASDDCVRVDATRVGDRAQVRVTDRGSGMTQDVIERAFEPFYSTRELCEGMGLGLHLVQQIIEQEHQGTVRLASSVEKGTSVTLELPL